MPENVLSARTHTLISKAESGVQYIQTFEREKIAGYFYFSNDIRQRKIKKIMNIRSFSDRIKRCLGIQIFVIIRRKCIIAASPTESLRALKADARAAAVGGVQGLAGFVRSQQRPPGWAACAHPEAPAGEQHARGAQEELSLGDEDRLGFTSVVSAATSLSGLGEKTWWLPRCEKLGNQRHDKTLN